MRVLGVDVGSVRVGVALSDPGRTVATPLDTLDAEPADGDRAMGLADRLATLARDHACDTVVVGLPRALSGRDTASTRMARDVAAALHDQAVLQPLSVVLWDERLTSVEAERLLVDAGRRRAQRRQQRDRVAATLILQGWLDAQRG